MLAEFRALRIPLILVDQLPSQVAPQVMKCTGTKLAFLQTEREERETVADAMVFGDQDYEEIARLLPGQAYLFAEGYHRAHRIRTPDVGAQLKLDAPPSAEQLTALMRDDCWFQEGQARRAGDVLLRFRSAIDRYGQQKERAHHQVEGLLQQRAALGRITNAAARLEACRELAATLRRTGNRITAAFERLKRGPCAEARTLIVPSGKREAQLEEVRQSQLHEFEELTEPQASQLKDRVDRSVALLRRGVFQEEES